MNNVAQSRTIILLYSYSVHRLSGIGRVTGQVSELMA
jgi:hypothetical protein